MKIDAEKLNYFYYRTEMHIDLVRSYAYLLYDNRNTIDVDVPKDLLKQVLYHDCTKFQEPEKTPYLDINWMYKKRKEGIEIEFTDELKKKMHIATVHHVLSNSHHPEFHDPNNRSKEVIKFNARDEPPDEIIDATRMPLIDICEMVADWMAIANERKVDPYDWAKKNINIRWKFTDEQVETIYKLLSVWENNEES